MSEIKGYVVRGFLDGGAAYAIGMEWTYEGGDPPERYATIDAAAAALERMVAVGCTDVRIFSVSPDGTETPLPTYEEAINALAMARDAAATALRAHGARGMGGAPSELEGCPPGALRALLRLLGGGQ